MVALRRPLQAWWNRMLESLLSPPQSSVVPGSPQWPEVDVQEDSASILLRAEVPGVEPADLEVQVEDLTLTLRGHRRPRREERRAYGLRRQLFFGAFSRTFQLPPTVELDLVRAQLRNGMLEVEIPKRVGQRVRTIPIDAVPAEPVVSAAQEGSVAALRASKG